MSNRLRRIARELLPPILLRGARGSVAPRPDAEPLSVYSESPTQTILNGGRVVRHRDTESDHGVIYEVFVRHDYDLAPLDDRGAIAALNDRLADPVIVDCGANIGASAIWFADRFPHSRVVALEPERSNYDLLCQNCEGMRVQPVAAAIASRTGSVMLRDPGEGEWGFRADDRAGGAELYEVPALALEDVLTEHGGDPFILKIDVEGAEDGLFSSAGEEFDRFPIVILELHDWLLRGQATSRSFLRWHVARKRDFIVQGPLVFSLSHELNAVRSGE